MIAVGTLVAHPSVAHTEAVYRDARADAFGPLRIVHVAPLRDGRSGVVAVYTRGPRKGEPVDWVVRTDGTWSSWGSGRSVTIAIETMEKWAKRVNEA